MLWVWFQVFRWPSWHGNPALFTPATLVLKMVPVLWCSESEPWYTIYLYTLGNGDRYSLLLRCHTTVMLMCVVDHVVAQPWWQLIHYNILCGRELVYNVQWSRLVAPLLPRSSLPALYCLCGHDSVASLDGVHDTKIHLSLHFGTEKWCLWCGVVWCGHCGSEPLYKI